MFSLMYSQYLQYLLYNSDFMFSMMLHNPTGYLPLGKIAVDGSRENIRNVVFYLYFCPPFPITYVFGNISSDIYLLMVNFYFLFFRRIILF